MDDKQPRVDSDYLKDRAVEGIRCPQCHCRHFYTYRTERVGENIRRTKVCRHCGAKIQTTETYRGQIR